MRYVLNGPSKECRNKKCTDKRRIKSTETTPITPAITPITRKNQTKASKQGVIERHNFF